jgi:hypothetical protein
VVNTLRTARSVTTSSTTKTSTTSSLTRRMVSTGKRTKTPSKPKLLVVTLAVFQLVRQLLAMHNYYSFSTWLAKCALATKAAAAWRWYITAHRSLLVPPVADQAKFVAGCSKTITSKPSSLCQPTCSTTPASLPMYGYSLTEKRLSARAKSSW